MRVSLLYSRVGYTVGRVVVAFLRLRFSTTQFLGIARLQLLAAKEQVSFCRSYLQTTAGDDRGVRTLTLRLERATC